MPWSIDARIPVSILPGASALEGALAVGRAAAVLGAAVPGLRGRVDVAFAPGAPSHNASCACCQGRSPAAQALDQLFQARARASRPWFDRVLVLPEGGAEAEIRAALSEDPVASARFRLA